MNLNQYLESLPVVETADLALDQLFYANQLIYQVVDVGQKGAYRARVWRQDKDSEVVLSRASPFMGVLPLVEKGQKLPEYASRNELLVEGKAQLYVFPVERNALDAAYLDVALCGRRGGLYVRRHEREPAFEATNGADIFRKYYFMRTNEGIKTALADLKYQLPGTLHAHSDGPPYWQFLSSWQAGPYDVEKTLVIPAVSKEERTALHIAVTQESTRLDETLPHIPLGELADLVDEELADDYQGE